MDQDFVDELVRRIACSCAEYDCTIAHDRTGETTWELNLYDEDKELSRTAYIQDAGQVLNELNEPVTLLKMLVDDEHPWTVYVSAVPKAVFCILWA